MEASRVASWARGARRRRRPLRRRPSAPPWLSWCAPAAASQRRGPQQRAPSHPPRGAGLGPGVNLKYFGARVSSIIGLDPNAAVQQYAMQAAAAAGLPPGRLQFVLGAAEELPLPDASVDAVVGTHVSQRRPGHKRCCCERPSLAEVQVGQARPRAPADCAPRPRPRCRCSAQCRRWTRCWQKCSECCAPAAGAQCGRWLAGGRAGGRGG